MQNKIKECETQRWAGGEGQCPPAAQYNMIQNTVANQESADTVKNTRIRSGVSGQMQNKCQCSKGFCVVDVHTLSPCISH